MSRTVHHSNTVFSTSERSGPSRLAYLEHALRVLEAVARHGGEVSLSVVAREVGVSKSGVYRILATLCAHEYVERTPLGRYRIGFRLWELSSAAPERHVIVTASPFMEQLTSTTNESSFLGVLDGFDLVSIYSVVASQPVSVQIPLGSRSPAHTTSTGLALLAELTSTSLLARLPARLVRLTTRTIAQRPKLIRELKQIRRRGYAMSVGGYREDAGGVAAAIFGRDGGAIAAICVSAPRTRLSARRLELLGAEIVKTAAAISRAFGFTPSSASATSTGARS